MTEIDTFSAIVGRRIQERRKAFGMNQTQLAELIGVGQTTIGNYERGFGLDLEAVGIIAQALETDAHGLLCLEDNPVKVIAKFDLSHVPVKTLKLLSACDSPSVFQMVEMILLGAEAQAKSRNKRN